MHKIYTLDNVDVQEKRVLLRVDLNVPMKEEHILDDERIMAVLPGIKELLARKAKVILCSHFGRPKGKEVAEFSLKQISQYLSNKIGQNVRFIPQINKNAKAEIAKLKPGEIALLENLRFYPGEENNDEEFAKILAGLADIYVNDGFSVSHRAHASVEAITKYLPSFAGRLLKREVEALKTAFEDNKPPLIAIVGGAKISTKLDVLKSLAKKVTYLVPAGGIANTFFLAHNKPVGKSLCEPDLIDTIKEIEEIALESGCSIIPPRDVVVTEKLTPDAPYRVCTGDEIHYNEMIVDFGPGAVSDIYKIAQLCRTLIWNGPLGVFEIPPFDKGSIALAERIAYLTETRGLYSVAGGGETLAVLNQAKIKNKFSYASTAGGAFLEWVEGKRLPGIEALKESVVDNPSLIDG